MHRDRKRFAGHTIIVFLIVAQASISAADPAVEISLGEPRFHASGRGDQTTVGTFSVVGSHNLIVESDAGWEVHQGIRVRRAGLNATVHDADSGWVSMHPSVEVTHVPSSSTMAARCSIGGDGPTTVTACGVTLPSPMDLSVYDEMRLLVTSSTERAAGDLQIVLSNAQGLIDFGDLELPALAAGVETEVFTAIQGEGLGGVRHVAVRCARACAGTTIELDDLFVVRDLVSTVDHISTSGGTTTFTLQHPARRVVSRGTVFHDDSLAVRAWLSEANRPGGALLTAPKGVYNISSSPLTSVPVVPNPGGRSRSLPLYSDSTVRCDRDGVVFKSSGGSFSGPSRMFRSAEETPHDISIEGCGFDFNGWNREEFLTGILIEPGRNEADIDPVSDDFLVRRIRLTGNRFFDSAAPGAAECDHGPGACAVRQRQYIVVRRVDQLLVEDNDLQDGGRIKVGGLGRGANMTIRRNHLRLVNDNGITIVDRGRGRTENVQIVNNRVIDAVTAGIFFGGDGPSNAVEGMTLRNITIANNFVKGHFITAGIKGDLPADTQDLKIYGNTVIASRQRPVHSPGRTPTGIRIAGAATPANQPAPRGIVIARNRILATGEHGVFNNAGLFMDGSMGDVAITQNTIRCEDSVCDSRSPAALPAGILWRTGTVSGLELAHNHIERTGLAVQIGRLDLAPLDVTGLSILTNRLIGSRDSSSGQVTLNARAGNTIEGLIARNLIQNGNGFGILCSGPGELALSIEHNAFVGHEGRETSGCPTPATGTFAGTELPIIG